MRKGPYYTGLFLTIFGILSIYDSTTRLDSAIELFAGILFGAIGLFILMIGLLTNDGENKQ